VSFEEAEDFAGDVRVATEYARARLINDPLDQRPHCRQPVLRASQDRSNVRTGRARTLTQPPNHGLNIFDQRAAAVTGGGGDTSIAPAYSRNSTDTSMSNGSPTQSGASDDATKLVFVSCIRTRQRLWRRLSSASERV